MRRCLVVCYSRPGLTARLGHEIATVCDTDLELIGVPRDRRGLQGFVRFLWDALRRR